ncbi:hypothetical protein [Thalassolituus oleivorans]|uniref:hypothetical protein n=1 Tax=Thalassolituus oleivorans TaxID=187493 RepID=UPI00240A4AA6|nr:hypothetical protein [Thalassolituus oleivorans]MDF1640634.1 hypothetical protein [Thalassolituus oleivorans]
MDLILILFGSIFGIFVIASHLDVNRQSSTQFWQGLMSSEYSVPKSIQPVISESMKLGLAYFDGNGWYPPNYVNVLLTPTSIVFKTTFPYRKLGCYEIPYDRVEIIGERRCFWVLCYVFKVSDVGDFDVRFLLRKKSFLSIRREFLVGR